MKCWKKNAEPPLGFDPRIHLKQADWDKATETLQQWRQDYKIPDVLTLLMQQHYLNPDQFAQGLQSGPAADWFNNLNSPEGQETILKKLIYQLLVLRTDHLLEELGHRAEASDLFPEHDFSPSAEQRTSLFVALRSYRQDQETEKVINTLYLMKQFPGPVPDIAKNSPTIYATHLTPEEKDRFTQEWQAVWGTGHLEDLVPDKLVRSLARIRIIDPELFSTFSLDARFWKLALAWLEELRAEDDSKSVFDFAFNLYLLSAGHVSLGSTGKLVIENKKTSFASPTPLPERNVA